MNTSNEGQVPVCGWCGEPVTEGYQVGAKWFHPDCPHEICAKCAWDMDDPKLPALCRNGFPHDSEWSNWN
jgi:hypothetical protein